MPPRGVHICVSDMRPIERGSVFAQRRSSNLCAPGPETSYFAKLVWSSTPTDDRTAAHSSRRQCASFPYGRSTRLVPGLRLTRSIRKTLRRDLGALEESFRFELSAAAR